MCSDVGGEERRLQPRERASRTATGPSRNPATISADDLRLADAPRAPADGAADEQDDGDLREEGATSWRRSSGKVRRVSILDRSCDPLDLLPHRPPMRLLDESHWSSCRERARGGRRAAAGRLLLRRPLPRRADRAGGRSWSRCWRRSAAWPPRLPTPMPPQLRLRVAALGPFKFPGAARPGAWLEARARVAGGSGRYQDRRGGHRRRRVVASGSVTLAEATTRQGKGR